MSAGERACRYQDLKQGSRDSWSTSCDDSEIRNPASALFAPEFTTKLLRNHLRRGRLKANWDLGFGISDSESSVGSPVQIPIPKSQIPHIQERAFMRLTGFVTLSLLAVSSGALAELPNPTGESIVSPDAKLDKLFTRTADIRGGLTEGPAVAPDGSVYFSDIPF